VDRADVRAGRRVLVRGGSATSRSSWPGRSAPPPLLTGVGRERHGRIARTVAALAGSGALRPVLDLRLFGLESSVAAREHVENGTDDGRMVIVHAHGSL
jgi:NADPH:quinone reductase-like Zn-dependent oxidoreductase